MLCRVPQQGDLGGPEVEAVNGEHRLTLGPGLDQSLGVGGSIGPPPVPSLSAAEPRLPAARRASANACWAPSASGSTRRSMRAVS